MSSRHIERTIALRQRCCGCKMISFAQLILTRTLCSSYLISRAAFDTVNHQILLQRLRDRFGICSTALSWFTSYLTDRKQCVAIGDAVSGFHTLDCGVPQGSVFGPLEFTFYHSVDKITTISLGKKNISVLHKISEFYMIRNPPCDTKNSYHTALLPV